MANKKPTPAPRVTRPYCVQLILEERQRQDEKWGVKDHDDVRWLAILTEEIGEVARSILNDTGYDGATGVEELVQVTAVALAWLEAVHRRRTIKLYDRYDESEELE